MISSLIYVSPHSHAHNWHHSPIPSNLPLAPAVIDLQEQGLVRVAVVRVAGDFLDKKDSCQHHHCGGWGDSSLLARCLRWGREVPSLKKNIVAN